MFEPRVIEEPDMPPDLDERIRQGLCICFPDDRETFSQTRAWHGSTPSYTIVIEASGIVAAHVGVVDRAITVGETNLRVAGIQNVFVLPAFRGKGLGDRILQRAMTEASHRGFDCGLLFCIPELAPFYQRNSWLRISDRLMFQVMANKVELPLPAKNIAMFYPILIRDFPNGTLLLNGDDW